MRIMVFLKLIRCSSCNVTKQARTSVVTDKLCNTLYQLEMFLHIKKLTEFGEYHITNVCSVYTSVLNILRVFYFNLLLPHIF